MQNHNVSLMKMLKQKTENNRNIELDQLQSSKVNNMQTILKQLQKNHNQNDYTKQHQVYDNDQQLEQNTKSQNKKDDFNQQNVEDQEYLQAEDTSYKEMMQGIQRKKKIKKQEKYANNIQLHIDKNIQIDKIQQEQDYDFETIRNLNNIQIKSHHNPELSIIRSLNQSQCYNIVKKQFLDNFHFEMLTPVQMQIIPMALQWSDIICTAPTGSGKTLSYLLPILNFLITLPRIKKTKWHLGPYALILVPSRELAIQIQEVFSQLSSKLDINSQCIVGGHNIQKQSSMLLNGSELIIATVGRFKDLLFTNKISLQQCYQIVIDEVDKMMDFQDDLLYIFQNLNFDKMKRGNENEVRYQEEQCVKGDDLYVQLMTFSATLPESQLQTIKQYTRYAYQVQIKKSESIQIKSTIQYEFEYFGLKDTFSQKINFLEKNIQNEKKKIIVFLNTKLNIERIEKYYNKNSNQKKLNFVVFHGDLPQQKREENLMKFRKNIDVLFTTDLGGRGLDIQNLNTVINFDLPYDIEKFIHRSGRTGRGKNNNGKIISYIGNNDSHLYKDLINFLQQNKQKIPNFMKNIKIFDYHILD